MRAVGQLAFAARRLLSTGPLAASMALGMVVTVVLVVAVPLYAEGVASHTLQQELSRGARYRGSGLVLRHYTARILGEEPPTREALLEADRFLGGGIGPFLGIPPRYLVRLLKTDPMAVLLAGSPGASADGAGDIPRGELAALTGVSSEVEILAGVAPSAAVATYRDESGEELPLIEAMLTQPSLRALGLTLGDRVVLEYTDPFTDETLHVAAVDIVGRFAVRDPDSLYWFIRPDTLDRGALLIDPAVFADTLLVRTPTIYRHAAWYTSFDPKMFNASNYGTVADRLDQLPAAADAVLPEVTIESTLNRTLERFDQRVFVLTVMFLVLSAPIVVIVLYFMRLAVVMVVERQRSDIAILKSRGASTWQVIREYLLEGLLLGAIALAVGPPLALGWTQLMGKTLSFLVFTNRANLPISLGGSHYLYAAGAVALAVAATLASVIGASRQSIVAQRQEASRVRRRPFYQRYFLDIALLVGAVYGYFFLQARDTRLIVESETELFSDAQLVVVPVLFIIAVAQVMLRLFPAIVRVMGWLSARAAGVGTYLSLRRLGRDPGLYTSLVLLLTMTFALGSFSASLAATLDRNISDRSYFQVGADARFQERGEFDARQKRQFMTSVDRHYDLMDGEGRPVFDRVARLWSAGGNLFASGNRRIDGPLTVYGVDPTPFAQTAWWRADFAEAPLNSLMNTLIRDHRGVLLERAAFKDQLGLRIGDPVQIRLQGRPVDFYVAGWINAFPTHYPEEGAFGVADLGYLHRTLGESAWDVLAQVRSERSVATMVLDLQLLFIAVTRAHDARFAIADARNDPGQIGIFGILTMGFLVSAGLTVVGFLVNSVILLRRRMQEFGVLRAMGLSPRQMLVLVTLENTFVMALAVVAGTALGVVTSTLFVPFFQLSADRQGSMPPFVVVTAWGDIAKVLVIFAVLTMLAVPASMAILRRVRIHEALKFGEETG